MPSLILLEGMAHASWYAEFALRSRVNMSAIGSVMVMVGLWSLSPWYPRRADLRRRNGYQLLLVMPGSSPRCAMLRRHTRQSPNLRYTE